MNHRGNGESCWSPLLGKTYDEEGTVGRKTASPSGVPWEGSVAPASRLVIRWINDSYQVYGDCAVGPVGDPWPAGQPDCQHHDRVIDDHPQAAITEIMRREGLRRPAAGAKLPVTRTSGASSAYSSVVLLDFAYSGRERRIDVDDRSISFGGARTLANWISLLFSCARHPPKRKKRGRGSRDNLQGRGSWRGTGRAQFGQIIRDSGRLFRSVKTGRRNHTTRPQEHHLSTVTRLTGGDVS